MAFAENAHADQKSELRGKSFYHHLKMSQFIIFPSAILWIALVCLIVFDASVIALSSQLTIKLSDIQSLMPNFMAIPVIIFISNLDIIASKKILSRMLQSILFLMFFMSMMFSLGVMGTIMAWFTTTIPMTDNLLDSWDKALGLDWLVYARWLTSHPTLMLFSSKCYNLLWLSVLLVGLEAIMVGENERCKSLILLALSACIISLLIGALFPTYGSVVHLATQDLTSILPPNTGTEQMAEFIKIRSGLPYVIDPIKMTGLVSFPSFHTICCVLLAYASRGNFVRMFIVTTFALLMLVAVPVFGEHYFVDIFAGAFIALAIIFAERRLPSITKI